ncbi:hypothetical protein N665_8107s0001, partial [Sinapis alba]
LVLGSIIGVCVDNSKRITRESLHVGNSLTNGCLRLISVFHLLRDPIRTRLLVRQRSAHPRLHVTHLKPKRLSSGTTVVHLSELTERSTHLLHGVSHVGNAVMDGG